MVTTEAIEGMINHAFNKFIHTYTHTLIQTYTHAFNISDKITIIIHDIHKYSIKSELLAWMTVLPASDCRVNYNTRHAPPFFQAAPLVASNPIIPAKHTSLQPAKLSHRERNKGGDREQAIRTVHSRLTDGYKMFYDNLISGDAHKHLKL